MLTRRLIVFASTAAALVAPVIAHTQGAQTLNTTANPIPPPTKAGHAEVRGVNDYYEVLGKGDPPLLLHWAADVKTVKMPVIYVCSDSDMFRPEHIVEFYHLLGGGLKDAGWGREHMSENRLAILPDFTHDEIGAAPALAPCRAAIPRRREPRRP